MRRLLLAIAAALALGACAPEPAFRPAALHEIGHVAGFEHTDDPSRIMHNRTRLQYLPPADRTMARQHRFPQLCFDTSGLGPYHASAFQSAGDEWNQAARVNWITFGANCDGTVSFGRDTKGHAAFTHPEQPPRIVFDWRIPWH